MKLFAIIVALAASFAAAHPIKNLRSANITTVESKLRIEFDGGFNALCDREVMTEINNLALSTLNELLREGRDEAFQFESASIDSEGLSTATHDGSARKLQMEHFDWATFIVDVLYNGECNWDLYPTCLTWPTFGCCRRHLGEDTVSQQLEAAIAEILPKFECMNGATDVYVSFVG